MQVPAFKSVFQHYLDNHSQINLIALQTGLIGGGLALFYAIFNPANEIIVMITGLLLNAMMLAITYRAHNSIQRLRYGLICALCSGLAFGLGSWTGSSLILSSLAILLLLPLVGLANGRHGLIAGLFFYIFDGYILGTGVHATAKMALIYAVCYFIGGVIIVFGGMIRVWVRQEMLNLNENIPFIQNQNWFLLDRKNLLFSCGLLVSVLICNYIAVYYHLDHGYWLPMTAFLLIKNDHQLTIQRSFQRIIGTLLGGGLAFGFCWLIQDKLILALIIAPMLYLSIIAISRHYGSFTLFLTVSISLLIGLQNTQSILEVKYRVLYTLIAVVIVMICLYVIQPLANQILHNSKAVQTE